MASLPETRRGEAYQCRTRLVRILIRRGARAARRIRGLTPAPVYPETGSVTPSSATFECGDRGKRCAPQSRSGGEVVSWLVILLIVLLVIVLFGGVGFSRR